MNMRTENERIGAAKATAPTLQEKKVKESLNALTNVIEQCSLSEMLQIQACCFKMKINFD